MASGDREIGSSGDREDKPNTLETQRRGGSVGSQAGGPYPSPSQEGKELGRDIPVLEMHQAGMVENHQHQAVDQRHLGKRLKIKEAEAARGWHGGCNTLGKG